ncbi:MAG: very short patch repair endonuclease [Candidatus Thorarchaeota archaeon]
MSQLPKKRRSPTPKSEAITKVMQGNKAKDTRPELLLRRALRNQGLSGYRVHWEKVPGNPDIAYPGRKIAIFVNGCFWHRCPRCNIPIPSSNTEYWKPKLEGNVQRDKRSYSLLNEMGWTVIVIWECEIKGNVEVVVGRIRQLMTVDSSQADTILAGDS